MLKVKNGFAISGADLNVIARQLYSNDFLLKLLYYPSSAPWSEPDMGGQLKQEVCEKCIRLVPKMVHSDFKLSFVVITFDHFRPTANPAYRSNRVVVDVICPLELWRLSDKMLRPYKIMAEIEKELTDKKLNGIGRLEFKGADSILLGDELAGFTMIFETINER